MASVTTGFDVEPLAAYLPFGVTVSGLTMDMLGNERVRTRLHELWIEKGVIVFRGCQSSPEMQIALSACFGKPQEHPFPETRLKGQTSLARIKYYRDDGTICDVDGQLRGGWLPWHSDLVYNPTINHGGILRPTVLPKKHGETGFICKIAAYDRLPQALRDRIEGLHVVYEIRIDLTSFCFNRTENTRLIQMSKSGEPIERRRFTYPRVIHPMVYTQEQTGRKVLNVSPTFALGIYEDATVEGNALLQEICNHCMDEQFAYFHEWQMDDMVLWDNWRILHSAKGVEPDDVREMARTTIHGDYALGRALGLEGPVAAIDI